jgi:hypothetical protein
MAEGRIYPFEYGIRDRILAGHAPAESRVREDLPIHLTSVIYPRAETPRLVVTRYLPEYGFAAAVPDWLIYRKKAEK